MCNKTVGFMSYTGKSFLVFSFTPLLLSFFLFFIFLFIHFSFYSCLAFFSSFLPTFQFLFLIYSFPPFCLLIYSFLSQMKLHLSSGQHLHHFQNTRFPSTKVRYCNSTGTNLSPRCSVFPETLTLAQLVKKSEASLSCSQDRVLS